MKKILVTIIGVALFVGTIAGENIKQLSDWSNAQAIGFNAWTLFCLIVIPYIVFLQFKDQFKKKFENKTEEYSENKVGSVNYKKYVNKYLLLGAIAILVIIGLAIFVNNNNVEKNISQEISGSEVFDKKIECSDKINLVKQELLQMKAEKGSKIVGNYELEEVFYSSKMDSCLFAYYYREEVCGLNYGCSKPSDYEYIDGFVIKDLLSNKILYNKTNSNYVKSTSLENFRLEITSLK